MVAAGVARVPQLDDEGLPGMEFLYLGEVELGVAERAIDVGVDRHVTEAVNPGHRTARGGSSQ